MKLIYAMCGSFCNHKKALEALEKLTAKHDVTAAMSPACLSTDTRFGTAEQLKKRVLELTGRDAITDIMTAEATVTPMKADCVIVSPCTGNTLAKIAHGITDTSVTMCVKCQLRNRLPVLISLATNDGLSANLFNIAMTLEKKNVFFVPFGQDDAIGKPTSLICDFDRMEEALTDALQHRQTQPILM